MHICTYVAHICTSHGALWRSEKQLLGVSHFFPSTMWVPGLNSGYQAWEPAPLPSESFNQLFINNRRMVSLTIDAKKDWKYYRLLGARECFLYLRFV